jgi:uncharacterized protein with PQ loop repeat
MTQVLIEVITLLGTTLGILINLASLPALIAGYKTRCLETISHMFLLFAHFNPLVWSLYAFKEANYGFLVPNITTVILSLINLVIYH